MEYLKKIKVMSVVATVLDSILVVLGTLAGIILIFYSGMIFKFADQAMDYTSNINPNSPSAGYEVLFGLSGTFLSGFAGTVLVVFGVLLFLVAVILLVPSIVGIVASVKNRKVENLVAFKSDGIVKLVCNGGFAILSVIVVCGDFSVPALIIALVFVGIIALSIVELVFISNQKQLELAEKLLAE